MSPADIVQKMLSNDAFSHWMNVEVISISNGSCTLKCIVKEEMLNGFEILHGGISYSLSDSALAFAANSYGQKCVSIETSISHTTPAKLHDELIIVCHELHRGKTIGIYQVEITNQLNKRISLFKGTVYITENYW
jgi:acyl-CoA thioesterase